MDPFKQLCKTIFDIRDHVTMYGRKNTQYDVLFKNLMGNLKAWHKSLISLSLLDKQTLVQGNPGELYKIYDTCVGPWSRLYASEDDKDKCRNLFDSCFGKLKISSPRTYFKGLPTEIFREFIQGITYFKNQEPVSRPVYHRDASCGSAFIDYGKKYRILEDDTPSVIRRNKNTLMRCYIERLIYDSIYQQLFHEQDAGHLLEIQQLERLVQDYTGTDVYVKMKYENIIYPTQLILQLNSANSRTTVATYETYTKPWGSSVVVCTQKKEQKKTHQLIHYKKTQTFEKCTEWIEDEI